MSPLLTGLLAGVPVGAASVVLMGACRRRASPIASKLTDADRDQLAREFAVHASAMRDQVDAFAKHLAAGDVLLRERLRRYQSGGAG